MAIPQVKILKHAAYVGVYISDLHYTNILITSRIINFLIGSFEVNKNKINIAKIQTVRYF